MPPTTFRFRVDPGMERLLRCLRDERDVNVSAWVRRHVREALIREFPDEATALGSQAAPAVPSHPEPHTPIVGWKPARCESGWGAAFVGNVGSLPADLVGRQIRIVPSQGSPWTATVLEVLERSSDRVLVRDSGRLTNRAAGINQHEHQ